MNMNIYLFTLPTALLLLLASTGSAQTITVDIADTELIDVDPDTATVADLPGPDGHISFSEAMIASNNTPGRQTVGFAIPTSEWTYLPTFYPGRAPVTGLMFYGAQDEVTIDGTTQTAFTGDTNPDGHEVMIAGSGLWINADNCRVTGLDYTTLWWDGSNGVIENNSVMAIDISGVSGGSGTLVRGNTGGTVQIDQSSDNVVVGNTFRHVRVLGWIPGGHPATNNRIGGPTLAERNYLTGSGSVSSQGFPGGYAIQLFHSIGTTIENNWIGTTRDGLAQGNPYTTIGISFDTENYDTVIRNNLIAGILAVARPPHSQSYFVGTGIQLWGTGSGVTIVGNRIGLNANDEPLLGGVEGITMEDAFYPGGIQNVVIGGTAAGEGNEIAGHLGTAIRLAPTYSGVRITGNSIHDNGGLGIDLITGMFQAGVTPNDLLDTDTGGNRLQNFPVIKGAMRTAGGVLVRGELASEALRTYTIDSYASSSLDPSGFGEGARFLGSTSVATNAQGRATFQASFANAVPAGWFVTATATDLERADTSEFSRGRRLVQAFKVR